jgi:glycosyltransferase involved in cell wall biosynthesis
VSPLRRAPPREFDLPRENLMAHGLPALSARAVDSGSLRVLYLVDSLGQGGAEQLLAAYLRHLPELGVTAQVCVLQERDGNPIAEPIRQLGIPVRTLQVTRLRRPDAYAQVARVVSTGHTDIVHTQLEFATILGGLAAHRRNIPMISTLHTVGPAEPGLSSTLRSRTEAWALRRFADRIVAVSESARREYLEHLRLPPEKVVTIHNGIDIGRFRMQPSVRQEVRAELGIAPEASLAVTVAVLRPSKGIDDMLAALPSAIERVPDLHYLIVGDGSARQDLERLASEQGLADRVTFAGDRSDVPRMLAAADAFVLPSHTEALPTVVAEAMAASLPVVATRVGGTPEMVDHHTGILVDPGDRQGLATAIGDVLSDSDRGRALGERGARTAGERFDIRQQAGLLVAEYRELLRLRMLR